MTPERISAEVSVAVAAVKARIASEDRVYPVPPGNPEAMAEVERGDLTAVQRRLARLFANNPMFRLPTEDGR